jgi:two-component system nitrate/nitrite response regulator NarL
MSAQLAVTAPAVAGPAVMTAAPRIALRVADPLRRRALERAIGPVAEDAADVLILELGPGEALPADAPAFEGALVVLSDESALVADDGLACVLPRSATPRQVAAAAAAVAEGLVVRAPNALREPIGFALPEPPMRKLLTPREAEVLAAVGQGLSNKAIARRLGISAHTVKYYLEAVFQKLEVKSRAEAVTRGLRLGVQIL